MPVILKHNIVRIFIAAVWLINGLFCKLLNMVPRHGEIVARFVGQDQARNMTILIGLGEILIAAWVFSNYKPRLNALVQIILVGTMNVLEFIFVPELLLWGRINSLFALIFIAIIYYNGFLASPKPGKKNPYAALSQKSSFRR
jgi:uncharacterized membrane protein YphA (DoxX/SURF4 family)